VATSCDPDTTLVIYMGLSTLPTLSSELLQGGLDPDTPAVAVERGTTPEQRAVYATLKELAEEVVAARLESPTLLVIGKVVALAPGWKRCRAEGRSLDVPGGVERLPLPVLPALPAEEKRRGQWVAEEDVAAGWRML
jgi:hypothetical protein